MAMQDASARQVRFAPQSNTDEGQCWICFEGGAGLIRPCRCEGSMKWVHRHCLDRWRVDASNPRNFTHCRHCSFKFEMELKSAPTPDEENLRRRRRRFMRRAIAGCCKTAIALQAGLILLALLLRAIDQHEVLVAFFNLKQIEGTPPAGKGTYWDAVLYHKSTYYLVAVLLAFFFAGLSACVGMCRRHCASDRRHASHGTSAPCPDCFGCNILAMQCCDDCCSVGCADCPACECNPSLFCPECEGSFCVCDDAGACAACAAVLLAVLAIAVVLVILAGLFAALVASVIWLQKVATRYMQLSQLREMTREYIVKDLVQTGGSQEALEMQAAPSQQHFEEGERVAAAQSFFVDPDGAAAAGGAADLASLERSRALRQSLLMDMRAVYGVRADIAV